MSSSISILQFPPTPLTHHTLTSQEQPSMSMPTPDFPSPPRYYLLSDTLANLPRTISPAYPPLSASSPLSSGSNSSYRSPVSDHSYDSMGEPETPVNDFHSASAPDVAPAYGYATEQSKQNSFINHQISPENWSSMSRKSHQPAQQFYPQQQDHQYLPGQASAQTLDCRQSTAYQDTSATMISPSTDSMFVLEAEEWEEYDSPVYLVADSPVHAKFPQFYSHSSSLALAQAQVHSPSPIRVKQEDLTIETFSDNYGTQPVQPSLFDVSMPNSQGQTSPALTLPVFSQHLCNSYMEQSSQQQGQFAPFDLSPSGRSADMTSSHLIYPTMNGEERACNPRFVSGDCDEEGCQRSHHGEVGEDGSDSDREQEYRWEREADQDHDDIDAEGENDEADASPYEDFEHENDFDDDDDGEYVVRCGRRSSDTAVDGRMPSLRSSVRRFNPYPFPTSGLPEPYGGSSKSRSRHTSTTSSSCSSSPLPPFSQSFYDPNPSSSSDGQTRRRSRPATTLPIPIPVPNLTKKSRGRRVPTVAALEGGRNWARHRSGDDLHDGRRGVSTLARSFTCKVSGCGKCFQRGEHLKRHVRSIHTHEKPHKCPYPGCGKDFSRHDNLGQHMRVHKGYFEVPDATN